MGPLAGIRVLDLSRVLAGPWATQLLADLGAEVIKVERPGGGDSTRAWGPPFAGDGPDRQAAYYLSTNRGKRSLGLDLARPAGRDIARALAARSDVLIENFKAGTLARHGLDYASLRALNRRLIYCSITGFGQTGPRRDQPGYDVMIQAMSGLMSVTGDPDGPPQKAGVAVADLFTGFYAATAIAAALTQRSSDGPGQHIDLALFDSQVACLANQAMNYLASGRAPTRMGNDHPNLSPYGVYSAADGHLVIAVGDDSQFERLCRVVGKPALAEDVRFRGNAARVNHREALGAELAAALEREPVATWLERIGAAGIPCGPINTIEQALADPQLAQRGMRISLTHPRLGEIDMLGNPIRFSDATIEYSRPPPLLGEHTDEILTEVGYDGDRIAALRAAGVIA